MTSFSTFLWSRERVIQAPKERRPHEKTSSKSAKL
jgi:hypothetical protein